MWTCGLAERVRLTVLTRKVHQAAIEKVISDQPAASGLKNVNFIFFDLTPRIVRWVERGWLPLGLYYIFWQWQASRKFSTLADEHDVVHHLTLCTLLCPGFWKLRNASFVVGPVGAPQVDPRYFPLFGMKSGAQRLRAVILDNFHQLPWLHRLSAASCVVVPANSATQKLLESKGVRTRDVMLDTGPPDVPKPPDTVEPAADQPCRFIYAGRLERRKGLEMALRAFAKATSDGGAEATFHLVGEGPDRIRLERMAAELGLSERVKFTGSITRDEVLRRFHQSDVFLFTSIRDTSGGVNLEAMACGLPVVCLAHQGVGDITTDACALRIEPASINETISNLAKAIRRISADASLRIELGREARRRAMNDFTWDVKFDTMVGYYREATSVNPAGRLETARD